VSEQSCSKRYQRKRESKKTS